MFLRYKYMLAFRNIFFLLLFSAFFQSFAFGKSLEISQKQLAHQAISAKQSIPFTSFVAIDNWEESEDDTDSFSADFLKKCFSQKPSFQRILIQFSPFSVEKKGFENIPIYIMHCVYRL